MDGGTLDTLVSDVHDHLPSEALHATILYHSSCNYSYRFVCVVSLLATYLFGHYPN